MTRPYAEVIGDPIAHSKSPLIHNFWLEKLDIDAGYTAIQVLADERDTYFSQRRGDAKWRGCNVTMPHKQAVSGSLDTISREASKVGAVNCVYEQQQRFIGHNTDVGGVVEAIASKLALDGGTACILGSGGAARAALYVLQDVKLHDILILSRDPKRAASVSAEFDVFGVGVPLEDNLAGALSEAELLINASPLGMAGQAEMPLAMLQALTSLADDALVFDMVYAPVETALLQAARARGLATADGLTMLIAQAAEAFRLFFGEVAPREHDAELRALLTA